jgi:hypothetical protein
MKEKVVYYVGLLSIYLFIYLLKGGEVEGGGLF